MNKSNLREEIFKLVYSLEVQKSEDLNQINIFLDNGDFKEVEKNKIKEDVLKIISLESEISEEISKNLKSDWNISRISKINMSILKIAIYEIIYKKLPYKIIQN